MFEYKSLQKQQMLLRKENKVLLAENEKLKADMDYIAMMTDIELETEENEDEQI